MTYHNRAPQMTAWGEKLDEREIMSGMTKVETARHGGIWLCADLAAQVPSYLAKYTKDGNGVWWEEDSAWSLAILYFLSDKNPDDLSIEEQWHLDHAPETANEWYPVTSRILRLHNFLRRFLK